MLACGSRVRARFGATQYGRERCPKTYRGVIVAAFDDGFFKVEYDDGEVEDRVDPRWIKIDSAPHPPPGNRALCEVRGGTSCEGRARGRSDAATSAGRTSKPSTKRPRANLAQQPAASPPAPVLQQQLRNDMAITIEQHGFVEAPTLFPAATCTKLRNLDRASAVEISNALQLTVTGPELRLVLDAAERSDVIRQAVLAVYGVEEYTVPKDSVKVLYVAPGSPPQIPHADDTCNREFFVIVQLNSGQAPTECVPYRSDVEYPLDPPLRAECIKCGRWCILTDYAARRREHCAKDFNCEVCGEVCGAPSCDDTQVEELFCDRLQSAFSELIDDPAALISKMRPCGPLDNRVGDGIVAMPTLVHRGPGTMSLAPGAAHRAVCFFTIRPKFRGERSALSGVGTYDANRQIHGAWLLWRLNDRLNKRARQSAVAAYAKEGYRLSDYGEELS